MADCTARYFKRLLHVSLVGGLLAEPCHAASAEDGIYQDHTHGFSISYGPDLRAVAGPDGTVFDDLDLKLAKGKIIESFIADDAAGIPGVAGAGVSIGTILPSTELGCTTVGMGEKTVGPLKFYGGVGAARTGPRLDREYFYLVQSNGACFEILEKIIVANADAEDSIPAERLAQLKTRLEKVALSFTAK